MAKITDFKRVGINPDIRGDFGAAHIANFYPKVSSVLKHSYNLNENTVAGGLTMNDIQLKYFLSANGEIYALGKNSSTPAVYKWNNSTSQWNTHFSFSGGGTTASEFIVYQDNFYGLWNGTHVWTSTVGGLSFNGSLQAVTYSTTAPPVHHRIDDNVYWFYDNKVMKQSGSTFTTDYLAQGGAPGLPDSFIITCGTEYGQYVAIGAYDTDTKNSYVILWDRDESIENSRIIKWGEEVIRILAVLDSRLIGVSRKETTANAGLGEESIVIKQYVGNYESRTVAKHTMSNVAIGGWFVYDKRLFFGVNGFETGNRKHYVASIDADGRLVYDYEIVDADGETTGIPPMHMYLEGDGMWVACRNGANYTTYSTSNAITDTATYVTRVYRSDDMTEAVDFIGAVVHSSAMPSGGNISLFYRKNDDVNSDVNDTSTWTQITNWDTVGDTRHARTKQGCTTKPDIANEIQFRLTAQGVDIHGIQIDLRPVKDKSYG